MNQSLPTSKKTFLIASFLLTLLWSVRANAQLHYLLSDVVAASSLDEVRRSPLGTGSETILTNNFIASPGNLVVDATNGRLLIADVRNNLPRIISVSLTSPYTSSTFLTPAAISGASNTALAGLVLDPANNFLYYMLSDVSATTQLDELRRTPLTSPSETILRSNFISSPGQIAMDVPNNRVFVADVRNNLPAVMVVSSASPYNASTFLTPALISGASSTALAGVAVDNTNGFLYYSLSDVSATTTLDELRRSPLTSAGETILRNNFISSAGPLAMDVTNSRVFAADIRNNLPQIIAINTASPYSSSTFLTPAAISGAASTALTGIVVTNGNPLPIKLMDFGARNTGNTIRIQWSTSDETEGTVFEVQRSTDFLHFETVRTVTSRGRGSSYSVNDPARLQGSVAYRLKGTELSGDVMYSKVVTVQREGAEGCVTVSSTASGSSSQITVTNTREAWVGRVVFVSDMQGRVAQKFALGGVTHLDTSTWTAGVYTLTLPDGSAVRIVK